MFLFFARGQRDGPSLMHLMLDNVPLKAEYIVKSKQKKLLLHIAWHEFCGKNPSNINYLANNENDRTRRRWGHIYNFISKCILNFI